MALARWQATIADSLGNIIPQATIEVRREVGGAPLAQVFADRDGLVPLGNPFQADADGFAAFHVPGGAYRITAVSGPFSRTWRYVGIGLAGESDIVTAASHLRIGNIQIAWGSYASSATAPPTNTFAQPFNNANYRLVLTPAQNDVTTPRYSQVLTRNPESFTAQTFNEAAGLSGVGGSYIAIGTWQ